MIPSSSLVRRALIALFIISLRLAAGPADETRRFDVAAGAAAETLKRFADQAGQQVVFPADDVRGVRTSAVKGSFTTRDGLNRLLAGTELAATFDERSGTFAVARVTDPNVQRAAPAAVPARQKNDAPRDEAITLSPFTVNAEADRGYAATSTLAGSRFNTELRDTAASISVLTSDFLSDIGATDFVRALAYANSAQPDLGDASTEGPNPNGNAVQGGPAAFRVRGQPSTRTRNYFTLRVEADTYNAERIEDARGPNSVLFGFGAPGGIINISIKQARLDRTFGKAAFTAASFGSHRATLDHNRVLLQGRVAVRLNALFDQANTFQEYAFTRDRRIDLAVKAQVTSSTQVRVDFERALIRSNKPRPFAMMDVGLLQWQQAGSPTFATAIASNPALSITRLGAARRLTYVGNNNTLIETGSTLVTGDPNTTVMSRSLVGPTINYGGPGQLNDTAASDFSVFVEQRLGRKTFLELGFNHQDQNVERYNPGQSNNKLWADPNQRLRDGSLNPFAGQLFMETSTNCWERNVARTSSNILRATASTEVDAGRWGNYRLAALGDYDRRANLSLSEREVFAGTPFGGAPESAANQVKRRNYFTPGVWNTYFINGPLTTGLLRDVTDPITGRRLTSTWVARSQSQEDDPETLRSWLVNGQARYFGGRLIVGAGTRRDTLEILDRTAQRDPVTQIFSRARATEITTVRRASNATFGVMGHATSWLSLFYNRANNQGLQSDTRIIDIDNLDNSITAPNSKGRGTDYGMAVTALGGRLHARLARYTTIAASLSDSYGVTGVGPQSASANILSALVAAGRITQAVADARTSNASGATFDMDSSGYELTVTANPTKHWRVQANYSYTDTHLANFGREVSAWMNREIAYWRSFNLGGLQTGQGRTIEEAIAFMLQGYKEQADLEHIGELGTRRHKANLFTRLDAPWPALRGAYVGGGYRYQSKNLAGADVTRLLSYYSKPIVWQADALAGYQFPKAGRHGAGALLNGLTLQLNVNNLFDDDGYVITRILPDGTIRRATPQTPRIWRLQASRDF